MYERFTDRAREVMRLATEEAQRRQQDYVGTEHLLLAIFDDESGVAATVLRNLHQQPVKIQRLVEKYNTEAIGLRRGAELPMTPAVKRVITYAMEECRALNHHYIGTEHLLLGMIHDASSFAGAVLHQFGLELGPVRQEIQRVLGYAESSPDGR